MHIFVRIATILLLSLSISALFAAAQPLKPKQNVVFIGDEVTAGPAAALGKEYKSDFSAKKSKFTVIKHKKGTWAALAKDIAKDLKKGKVDKGSGGRVIIALGMYDACDVKKGTGPITAEADLVAAIDTVVTACQAHQLSVILCTPGVISSKVKGADLHIDAVAATIRDQAQKHDLDCLDLRAVVAGKNDLVKKGIALNEKGQAVYASVIDPSLGVVAGVLEREVTEADRVKIVGATVIWKGLAYDIQENGKSEIGAGFSCQEYKMRLDNLFYGDSSIKAQGVEFEKLIKQKASILFLICGDYLVCNAEGNMAKKAKGFTESAYESMLVNAVDALSPSVSDLFLVTHPPVKTDEKSENWILAERVADVVRSVGKKKRIPVVDGHKICVNWMKANGMKPVAGIRGNNVSMTDTGKSIISPVLHGILGLGNKSTTERLADKRKEAAKKKASGKKVKKSDTGKKDEAEKKKESDKKEDAPKVDIDDLDLDSLE